ncbi:cation:proton antiporter [Candidatus Aciduliprofundum boonei]|uniref:Multiple resistance and pH regulation protein F n=1 Tax=Aciduliprofundum boonei (strain DSM 19572 / T469) TaxID=439481 RepID=D3TD41_ACIB4|nr:cation:proton antiporter [Candidatus Aciduliprofundum boonei]ADD08476.1 multiple resistance and pH regulation protein F [Aciduliprofundum boonei T469]HII55319.1 cation:proton antiporter [Candidatus Aciduliprofundum boonei]
MIDIWFLTAFILMVWIFMSLIRIILGPTAPDRVVGLDTINTLIVALMVILAVAYNQMIYVDIAIVYALLSFVSTLYIAKYLEGGI